MNQKEKIHFIFQELTKRYAGSTTELIYRTPFQLLVAVIMSAQTTDKQVNKVTAHFFDKIIGPKDLLQIPFDNWEQMIKWVNYYRNKAKNIYKLAGVLVESKKNISVWNKPSIKSKPDKNNLDYIIPNTLEELILLPGVGEKTAKVILQVLHGHDVIAVDTHVHRVTNRLWIVKTNQPLQTSKILESKVPKEFRKDAHHALILFGRYHCTARNPKCETCPFTQICLWYKANKKYLIKKNKHPNSTDHL